MIKIASILVAISKFHRWEQSSAASALRSRRARGVKPISEYRDSVRKHTKEERKAILLERIKVWFKANQHTLLARKKTEKEAEKLRSCFVDYPPDHKIFINRKRRSYRNLWLTLLHDKDNPKPLKQIREKKPKSLDCKVRRRLKRILKTKIGIRSCELIGCNSQFLKSHLELQFKPGMSWSNYGTTWHIDHIIPLSKFDLSNPFHLKSSCHYSNLQPMLAMDNVMKRDSINSPIQPCLPLTLPETTIKSSKKKSKKKT